MQPVPGQPVPPVQEIYQLSDAEVQEGEEGTRILLVRIFAPNKLLIFMWPKDEAIAVGEKLMAPSVDVPKPGLVIPGA